MIKKIEQKSEKSAICNKILRELPNWFGIESAIVEYVNNVQDMPFWAIAEKDSVIGFLAVKFHFDQSAEIYVMGVLSEYHQKGYGKMLVDESEKLLISQNYKYYQVKTLSDSHPHEGYAKTRKFYQSCGFVPIEEFKTLWGEANPALLMMKNL